MKLDFKAVLNASYPERSAYIKAMADMEIESESYVAGKLLSICSSADNRTREALSKIEPLLSGSYPAGSLQEEAHYVVRLQHFYLTKVREAYAELREWLVATYPPPPKRPTLAEAIEILSAVSQETPDA
jgi:hypothetical protein